MLEAHRHTTIFTSKRVDSGELLPAIGDRAFALLMHAGIVAWIAIGSRVPALSSEGVLVYYLTGFGRFRQLRQKKLRVVGLPLKYYVGILSLPDLDAHGAHRAHHDLLLSAILGFCAFVIRGHTMLQTKCISTSTFEWEEV